MPLGGGIFEVVRPQSPAREAFYSEHSATCPAILALRFELGVKSPGFRAKRFLRKVNFTAHQAFCLGRRQILSVLKANSLVLRNSHGVLGLHTA